jgi:hypothetical protein
MACYDGNCSRCRTELSGGGNCSRQGRRARVVCHGSRGRLSGPVGLPGLQGIQAPCIATLQPPYLAPRRETRYFCSWKRRRHVEEFMLPACVAQLSGQDTCPIGDAGRRAAAAGAAAAAACSGGLLVTVQPSVLHTCPHSAHCTCALAQPAGLLPADCFCPLAAPHALPCLPFLPSTAQRCSLTTPAWRPRRARSSSLRRPPTSIWLLRGWRCCPTARGRTTSCASSTRWGDGWVGGWSWRLGWRCGAAHVHDSATETPLCPCCYLTLS